MRRTVVLFAAALAAAAPALAQSNRGRVGIDAMVAPTSSLGVAFYLTDGLSLRPWLGLGYSDYSGFFANTGAQLRYELAAASRLSPYVSATAQFSHIGNPSGASVPVSGVVDQQLAQESNVGQFGSGLGARYRLPGNLALFGEGRVMYATSPTYGGSGWTTVDVNDRTRVDLALGLTYVFGGKSPRRRP